MCPYVVRFVSGLSGAVSLHAFFHLHFALHKGGGIEDNQIVYFDYQYVVPQTGVANTYLTGAYKDPDYKANVYFVGITYRF